jgi:1-acyl-sn-glycerol-3-phosphate acyltransferase
VRASFVYDALAAASAPVLYGPFRLRASGIENLPDGGFVLAANHISSFDPWPLGLPIWPERRLRFMAKSELYWWPLRHLLDATGAFRVRRGTADRAAIETAVNLCRAGEVVAMFPEGTRREKGVRKKFDAAPRTGAARIALRAGVPLVPAATKGTERRWHLGPLRVGYGAPVELDDLRSTRRRGAAHEATNRLMQRIAELEAAL